VNRVSFNTPNNSECSLLLKETKDDAALKSFERFCCRCIRV